MRLSPFQRRVLQRIAATGGRAVWGRGGYWFDAAGERLIVEPEPGSVQAWAGRKTIDALAKAGALKAEPSDRPSYTWPYVLTPLGQAEAARAP